MDFRDYQFEICQNLLPEPYKLLAKPPCSIHLPELLPKNNSGKTKRKHCKYCLLKYKKRKDSIYCCSQCPNNPGFCIVPCFREYHSY